MFEGEVGRSYWRLGGPYWLQQANTPRQRRFVRIIDNEYHRAVASGPPLVDDLLERTKLPTRPEKRRASWRLPSRALLSFAGGILVGATMSRLGSGDSYLQLGSDSPYLSTLPYSASRSRGGA
jgi:hypothetical protein